MSALDVVKKHPHIFRMGEDGVLEMYVDHHQLSTMRTCEAKFYEEQFAHVGPRTSRYFSLEFGCWFHEILEDYYNAFKKTGLPPVVDEWISAGLKLWNAYGLDDFAPAKGTLTKDMYGDKKKYYALCNWDTKGAITRLMIQYYTFYANQRMRVVDTEISFGRAKEVYLGEFYILGILVRCYLTGRIDLLVDNGTNIGPVDHKSTAKFDGYESDDFDPHEGITGYIYAINSILASSTTESEGYPQVAPRLCRGGWIYHVSLADNTPRFKPTPVFKTPQQLEDYRKRQLRTCQRIYNLAASTTGVDSQPFNYGSVEFNALICNNIYNSPCPFRELHRQPFIQREGTITQFYQINPAWDPAKPPTRKREELKNVNNGTTNTRTS